MSGDERERFAVLVGSLAEAFGRDMTEGLLCGWWLALRDIGLDAFERGVVACLRECVRMPVPVEIRERAGAGSDQAHMAWERMLAAIRGARGEDVRFEDGLTASIVERCGGWEWVTGLESGELLKWSRKEFLELYRSGLRQGAGHEPREVAGWLGAGSPKGCATMQHVAAPYLAAERIGAGMEREAGTR